MMIVVVACGRTQNSDGSKPNDGLGDAGEESQPSAPSGGPGGDAGVGGKGPRLPETGGSGPQVSGTSNIGEGGAPTVLGQAGEAGGGNVVGVGGEPDPGSCEDNPVITGEPALATTSLTVVDPLTMTLGQGFQREPGSEGEGQLRAPGCVTGQETNQFLALGTPTTTIANAGTRSIGTMRRIPPALAAGSPSDPYFDTRLSKAPSQSLYGYWSTSIELWSYSLLGEQRSQVSDCGDAFVRFAVPARALTVALKLTFRSEAERDRFSGCFDAEDEDITKRADSGPISRYLVAHEASLAIDVLAAAGPVDAIQQALHDTKCSAANLPACAETFDALEELQAGVSLPDETKPLAELPPEWGIFSYDVAPYTVLP